MLSGNCLRKTVHTNRASVHQAAKLVAALLRVAAVTAGLLESNGSLSPVFMTYVTCRLTINNRPQLRNPTLGNRVWATFTFKQQINGLSSLLSATNASVFERLAVTNKDTVETQS